MDAVQEVKSRLDIADIVGEYLQLKPAGSGSFRALCPFHQEKTPSFYVNRPRQSWHCFGCNKGGDMLSFIMDLEGMGFRDALEHLAQKAGVTLPDRTPADLERAGERKRLHEVNELAARFFRGQLLQSPDAAHARSYAASRDIDDLTGDLFHIGYAPKAWDALTRSLLEKGVTGDELIRAGLSIKHEERGSVYDRFRDRLMFAIQDVHGNTVGFTGRLLDPNAKEAKYVNTPETSIYKKSAVLYGLDKAKGDIKRQDLAVIVEGNMDVVSSHRAGVCNVVCSSGTALTEEQLHLLLRFTKNLAIAFDADAAGMTAALRGLDLARTQDFRIQLIALPPGAGKDPDDAIRANPDIWKQAITDRMDVMDWVFRAAFTRRDPSNPEEKRRIAADVLPEIRRVADPIVRDHWMRKLAEALSVSQDALREALQRSQAPRATPERPKMATQPKEAVEEPRITRVRDVAESLLSLLLAKPEILAEEADASLASMMPQDLGTLYTALKTAYDPSRPSDTSIREQAAEDEASQRLVDYLVIRADRDFPEQSLFALKSAWINGCKLLRQLHTSSIRQRVEADMRAAELSGDNERIAALSAEFAKLLEP